MTGFARTSGALDSFSWTWELKSVNGRNLDIRCRLPLGFESLDNFVRTATAERLKRGNLAVTLTVEDAGSRGRLNVNREALAQVLSIVRDLESQIEAAPPRLDGILGLKGVMEVELPVIDAATTERRLQAVQASFGKALADLASMRLAEGARLQAMVDGHLSEIDRLRRASADSAGTQPASIRLRLEKQIAELMPAGINLSDERLAQEVALLAGKADVREELDRLNAHVAAARDLLAAGGAVGRKFDFLCQEFNREANTLCSKSADLALTSLGIELKSAIEQLREQIQNIE